MRPAIHHSGRRRRGALSALACAAVLAGCGAAPRASSLDGRALFASECSVCHSLIGNESLRKVGGDLLGYRFTREELLSFTREMPVRHHLSAAQLDAVVGYVLAVQRR